MAKSNSFVRLWLAGLRVVSAVFALVGLQFLRLGYPPQGSDGLVPLVLGAVLVLLGIVGVLDPIRVTPARGSLREHSD